MQTRSGGTPDPTETSASTEAAELKGVVGELVRKAVTGGLGAVLMGEESLRRVVGELKLPKEVSKELVGFLGGQADRTRSEIVRIFRKEIRGFLNSDAFRNELHKLLSGLTLEVTAQVRLRPEPGQEQVTTRVRLRKSDESKGSAGDESDSDPDDDDLLDA